MLRYLVRGLRTAAKLCKNHYETLGISRDATQAEVKAAYYKSSMRLHPDKVTGNREEFEKITTAYKALSDARLRKTPDQSDKDGATVKSERTQRQLSGSRPIFNVETWMTKHYPHETADERMQEAKNRNVLRKMKEEREERDNVVVGVLACAALVAALVLIEK